MLLPPPLLLLLLLFGCRYRGSCWIDPSDPLLGNLIKISHFGFHQTDTKLSEFKLMPQRGASCHVPERDIVAAPYSWQQEVTANETYKTYDAEKIPNGTLLFFAGSIRETEPEYSGGVRQVGIRDATVQLREQNFAVQDEHASSVVVLLSACSNLTANQHQWKALRSKKDN